jgi:hypothetical protein
MVIPIVDSDDAGFVTHADNLSCSSFVRLYKTSICGASLSPGAQKAPADANLRDAANSGVKSKPPSAPSWDETEISTLV